MQILRLHRNIVINVGRSKKVEKLNCEYSKRYKNECVYRLKVERSKSVTKAQENPKFKIYYHLSNLKLKLIVEIGNCLKEKLFIIGDGDILHPDSDKDRQQVAETDSE